MTKKIYMPREDKLRVLGFASGSGNSLWKAMEQQEKMNRTMEGCPYEIVGVFSDNPDSKAIEYAKEIGLPSYSLNLREFYKSMGKPLTDMETRAAYDAEVYEMIRTCEADMILLAGYVWATTDILVNNYLVVNIHPADLSVIQNGIRPYAGGNGVGDTIRAHEATICASSHIATAEIDGGPLLHLSPKITLDYTLFETAEDMKRHYLKQVNEYSRSLAARVLLDIAEGRFEYGEEGTLRYKGELIPFGYRINSWEEDKPRFERDLSALVSPGSVAVVGASGKGGLGYSILHNAKKANFNGALYAVNRRGESVDGVTGYQTIGKIPGPVDLAILAVPSDSILEVARDCGEKGVRALVCITAGFRETGSEGAENEKKLKQLLDRYNMRMLGPNCMGIFNTDDTVRLNTTMLQHTPRKGPVAFVTQSGAIGAAMLDYSDQLGMGFSIIASLGNQADVNVNDMLAVLAEDSNTKVILLYLEAVVEPMRFLRIAKQIVQKKPILLIKSARCSAGASAASSHTGSIAGSDDVLSALLDKIGVIRVDTLEQGYYTAMAMSKMPPMKGNRVGVLTNAGGPGILAVDSLSNYGFEMPLLPQQEREVLAEKLLKEASTGNPIDVVAAAPPSHYAEALRTMISSRLYDAILIVCVPPATIDTGLVAVAVVEQLAHSNIPVLCNFIGPTLGRPARQVFNEAGIPCVDYPEKLAEILHYMQVDQLHSEAEKLGGETQKPITGNRNARDILRSHEMRQKMKVHNLEGYLSSDTAFEILERYGFDIPRYSMARENTPDHIAYPVVAKIEHEEIVHKSDAGGVVLNINNRQELDKTIGDLLRKFSGAKGVLIQQQCRGSLELILGGKKEGEAGSVLMIGAGGTGVEIYQDVKLCHVPVSSDQVKKSIVGLKCYPLLQGYRGKQGVNIEKLGEMINRLSQMLYELPEIKEIDLNPVIYEEETDSFKVLDCRIRV